jgi:hypothetical protein
VNRLSTLLEIDTCPICGQEMWLIAINDSKKDSFWEPPTDGSYLIACTKNKCCSFRITQENENKGADRWSATLTIMEEK